MLNSAQLDTRCLQQPACVLLLRGRKYTPYEKQWLAKLQQEHRTLQFAWLDASRLALSIESFLPPFVAGEHRLVLFRRSKQQQTGTSTKPKGGVVTAKAYRNDFESIPVGLFLKEYANAELKALAKAPTVARRSALNEKRETKTKTKTTKKKGKGKGKGKKGEASSTTPQTASGDDDDVFPQHATESVASEGDSGDDSDDLEVLDLDLEADDE